MEYMVTSELGPIDFGAAGFKEILQNARMILTTVAFSCPLDRDFAWSQDLLDAPIGIVQAKMTARIVEAFKKYEPRAVVTQVSYQGEALNGTLKPIVRVVINNDEA